MTQMQNRIAPWTGLLATYKNWLPVTDKTPLLTLQEGNTPLLHSARLSDRVGANVYLKLEGQNPTGSFKDRGMVLAVAKAKEAGAQTVVCASTGNTSASAAAYAARAGMKAVILIPDGYVALGKLAQAILYGAQIVAVRGNFDEALQIVRDVADPLAMTVVNSINPYRLEGQQTAAFEVCDALLDAPHHLCIPVGNAGNISAYWKGFVAYHKAKLSSRLPRMHGFEAEGAAALVRGEPILHPDTFATAIRIGRPASGQLALAAAKDSQGGIHAVTDKEIEAAYQMIADEGVFAEPASAASVAGLLKLGEQRAFQPHEKIVCVLTGNGLKDPDNAIRIGQQEAVVVDCNRDAVVSVLQGPA